MVDETVLLCTLTQRALAKVLRWRCCCCCCEALQPMNEVGRRARWLLATEVEAGGPTQSERVGCVVTGVSGLLLPLKPDSAPALSPRRAMRYSVRTGAKPSAGGQRAGGARAGQRTGVSLQGLLLSTTHIHTVLQQLQRKHTHRLHTCRSYTDTDH